MLKNLAHFPAYITAALSLCLILCSCANLKDYRFVSGGTGLILGASLGANQTLKDQSTSTNSLLWGASLATAGFILGEYLWSDANKLQEIKHHNVEIEKQLQLAKPPTRKFRQLFTYESETILGKGDATLKLPKKTQVLVFSTDDWKFFDNKLYHQSLQYEFYPPEDTGDSTKNAPPR